MPDKAFHWIRVQTFCHATEDEDLLERVLEDLVGEADEFSREESEGEHGNAMAVLEARLSRQRQYATLFGNLGEDVRGWILADLDNRVDENCVFYLRLDKQRAVAGEYVPAHHGDVVSITGRVQAHPARKEVAEETLRCFLESLGDDPSRSSSPRTPSRGSGSPS